MTFIILVCRASEEEGSWEAQAKCLAFISISRLLIEVVSHPWVFLIHRSYRYVRGLYVNPWQLSLLSPRARFQLLVH